MSVPADATTNSLSYQFIVPAWYPGGKLDQFIWKIPFEKLDRPGLKIKWNRGTFTNPSIYSAGGALTATTATMSGIDGNLYRIGDVAQIDWHSADAASNAVDQLQVQVEAKKVGILRYLGQQILEGTGSALFEGFKFWIDSSQVIDAGNAANGAPPTLADLHKLVYKVTASDGCTGGGPACLVGTAKAVRFIISLLEAAAGGNPEFHFDAELNGPVLYFNGIPVYIGQNAENETLGTGADLTSIWAVKLGGPTGVRVVHSSGTPYDKGIEVVDVPNQDASAVRGKLVSGHYGLLVPEVESIARLRGCDLSGLI